MLEEAPNQPIFEAFFKEFEVEVTIKREDILHPTISGNKFRKLKYNLAQASQSKATTLLTFGGAYSNHIHACAYAGKKFGFRTVGVIRGEELGGENLKRTLQENPTLAFAVQQGMQLHFVNRADYRFKETTAFQEKLRQQFGDYYLLPEGGTNDLAIKGCEEILTAEDAKFTHVCCAVGTGGTVSGIINSSLPHQQVWGFPVLKANYLAKEIQKKVNATNWKLVSTAALGGYAKVPSELVSFINSFGKKHQIPLDPIYTGKLLWGIYMEVQQGNFPKKSRILAIHTGGLQGIAGMNTKLAKKSREIINFSHEF